jgi:hypothetical protein
MQTLKITVELAFAWWSKPVDYSIALDNLCLERKQYDGKLLTVVSSTFVLPVNMGWHEIAVRLEEKTESDMYRIPETGAIIRDKYIDVRRIYINNLGFPQKDLIRLDGMYYKDSDPINPVRSTFIGDQGTFKFKFKTPFEYWALQTLVTD